MEKKAGFKFFFKRLYRYRKYLLMLLPAVVFVLIFSYYPMTGIIVAFKKYTYKRGIWGSKWIGFDNFRFFFKSGQAGRVIRNTILYNVVFMALGTALQVTVAIFLTEIRGDKFRKYAQTLMFLPHFISWVVVGVLAFNLFSSDYGYINRLLVSLGGEKYPFYTSPGIWPFILTFFNLWKGVGYGSVVYLAAIMGIDTSIYEAAYIDGATVFQRIFRITVPCIMPTVVILFLMSVGGIFRGNFDMFYNLVGNNGLLFEYTDVIDTLTTRALISSSNYGMSSAVGLMQSVMCFITVILANRAVNAYDPDYALF